MQRALALILALPLAACSSGAPAPTQGPQDAASVDAAVDAASDGAADAPADGPVDWTAHVPTCAPGELRIVGKLAGADVDRTAYPTSYSFDGASEMLVRGTDGFDLYDALGSGLGGTVRVEGTAYCVGADSHFQLHDGPTRYEYDLRNLAKGACPGTPVDGELFVVFCTK